MWGWIHLRFGYFNFRLEDNPILQSEGRETLFSPGFVLILLLLSAVQKPQTVFSPQTRELFGLQLDWRQKLNVNQRAGKVIYLSRCLRFRRIHPVRLSFSFFFSYEQLCLSGTLMYSFQVSDCFLRVTH